MAKETKEKNINIKPLGDGVLVRREGMPEKKSPAGIIIPDTAQKEKSKIGVVVEVGPGKLNSDGKLVPMNPSIKVGVKVFFNAGWDNEVNIGDEEEEHFLVAESDIKGIIK